MENLSIMNVWPKNHSIKDFQLTNGYTFPNIQIAYETYGELNSSEDNVVLICHGYAGHPHVAGFYHPDVIQPGVQFGERGWWDALIGPGKAIDTNRLLVIASNTLGSSYGTTGPACINPVTNKPYGPDFPNITIVDMINAQHALLKAIGINHLKAVVGYSYGGYQAFQWAVTFPNFVDGVVVVCSSPKGNHNPETVVNLISRLAKAPNWNEGWYYDQGGINDFLTEFDIDMLKIYSTTQWLENVYPNITTREADIRKCAETWGNSFDGNSLITLRRAAEYRDAEKDFQQIKAKVLYVLCKTDQLFPPSIAPDVMSKLSQYGVDMTYFMLDSDHGHLGAVSDALKWEQVLRDFLSQMGSSSGDNEG